MVYKKHWKNNFTTRKAWYEEAERWGGDLLYTRNDPPVFPQYNVFIETENHYSYINLQVKKEFESCEKIEIFNSSLLKQIGYEIGYIRKIEENGLTNYIFRRNNKLPLPPDTGFGTRLKYVFNARDEVSIIVKNQDQEKQLIQDVKALFATFFNDSLGREIQKCSYSISMSDEIDKWQRKKRQHPFYDVPHSDSKESKIEEIFERALIKHQICFEKQAEIFFDGKIFTIPDFLIREPLIAIYCDGMEFHKAPDKMIRDSQQSNILQNNGFRVFRFFGSQINSNVESCIETILTCIRGLRSNGK